MGLFDYVRCEYPLGSPSLNKLLWQSKDTPLQGMARYKITADGRLVDEDEARRDGLILAVVRGRMELHTVHGERFLKAVLTFSEGRIVSAEVSEEPLNRP